MKILPAFLCLLGLGKASTACKLRGELKFLSSRIANMLVGTEITVTQVAKHLNKLTHKVPPVDSHSILPPVDLANRELVLRYAMYASLAYFEDVEELERFSRVPATYTGNYQLVTRRHLDGIKTFIGGLDASYTMVVNHDQRVFVLAWRGSSNIEDLIADMNANKYTTPPEPFYHESCGTPLPGQMFVSEGFASTMSRQVLETMALDLTEAYIPGYQLVLVGHSLGAVKAIFSAIYISLYMPDISVSAVYSFGQPIFSSTTYAEWAANCIGADRIVRIVSSTDIVPQMHLDYDKQHPGNVVEVFFPDAFVPAYNVCLGGDDPNCSAGIPCSQKDWMHHSDFGGLRITQSLALLGGGIKKGERMRPKQIVQFY